MTQQPTRELRRPTEAPALYAQDGQGYDATVFAHYYIGGSDWLVTEYDPADDIAFGWACLNGDRQNAELGYTSLAELEQVHVPLTILLDGQRKPFGYAEVEFEEGWTPMTLTEALAELDRRHGR